jgi:hypothetical protein
MERPPQGAYAINRETVRFALESRMDADGRRQSQCDLVL